MKGVHGAVDKSSSEHQIHGMMDYTIIMDVVLPSDVDKLCTYISYQYHYCLLCNDVTRILHAQGVITKEHPLLWYISIWLHTKTLTY